jgi:hypothetical protein
MQSTLAFAPNDVDLEEWFFDVPVLTDAPARANRDDAGMTGPDRTAPRRSRPEPAEAVTA